MLNIIFIVISEIHGFSVVINLAVRSLGFCCCFVLSGHEGICSMIKKNMQVNSAKMMPTKRKQYIF